jgi:DivIVA domain-containing protein
MRSGWIMALNPDEIERMRFTVTRRGYDSAEVDTFLAWLANELRNDDDFDRAGTEVATALRRLHRSVLDIQSVAEEEADSLRTQTSEEADRIRAEADDYASQVRAAADQEVRQHRERIASEAAALRTTAEAENAALTAATREALTEAQRILTEAEERSRTVRAEADAYLESATVLAERSARARAVAAVQDLRDDLARLVYERETVRTQLRQLRTAIASAIEMAAGGEVDLTQEDVPEADNGSRSGQPTMSAADAPQPVDEIVDEAVSDALGRSPEQLRRF